MQLLIGKLYGLANQELWYFQMPLNFVKSGEKKLVHVNEEREIDLWKHVMSVGGLKPI